MNKSDKIAFKTAERLRISQEIVEQIVQQSGKIICFYDLEERTLELPEYAQELLGIKSVSSSAPEDFIHLGLIKGEGITAYQQMFERIASGVPRVTCTCKMERADGEVHWYEFLFITIFDEENIPIAASGTLENISEKKEIELLNEKQRLYTESMLNDSIAYFEYDFMTGELNNLFGDFTERFVSTSNFTYVQVLSYIVNKMVYGEDKGLFITSFSEKAIAHCLARGNSTIELDFRSKDGDRIYWTMATMHLLENIEKRELKIFFYVKDIDTKKREQIALRYASEHDQLTNLYNKKTTTDLIEQLLLQSKKDDIHAFFIVDIDNFKNVNDTLGHAAGDKVLMDIASCIRTVFRKDDIVGRIGGDEFVIFSKYLPSRETAIRKAQKICNSLICRVGEGDHVTGSIGMALFPQDATSFQELYECADKALYIAKKRGKNQYAIYAEI